MRLVESPSVPPAGVVPVIYIGAEPAASLVHALRMHGIAMLPFRNPQVALRLLRHSRVAAVLYAVPDLQGIEAFVATQTPVIVLAAGDAEWGTAGVTVIDRRSEPMVVAALIRDSLLPESRQIQRT